MQRSSSVSLGHERFPVQLSLSGVEVARVFLHPQKLWGQELVRRWKVFIEWSCQSARLLLFWDGKPNRITYDLLEMDGNQQVLPGRQKQLLQRRCSGCGSVFSLKVKILQ